MKNPLISVITPVYNSEKYLDRLFNSVLNQTYKNLEIIIVDDGSTDNSWQIIQKYSEQDKRIKCVHFAKNKGVATARNEGLKNVTGEYIAWIDSDDEVDLDYIEYLYNLAKEHSADISICESINPEQTLRQQSELEINELTQKELLEFLLKTHINFAAPWAKLFKAKLFKDVKFPTNLYYEDIYTTHLAYLSANKIAYSNAEKYKYYNNQGSIVHAEYSKRDLDYISATTKLAKDITDKYPDLEYCADYRVLMSYLTVYGRMEIAGYQGKEKTECYQYIKEKLPKYLGIDSEQTLQRRLSFMIKHPVFFENIMAESLEKQRNH